MRSLVRSLIGLTLGAACAVAFFAPTAQATDVHMSGHQSAKAQRVQPQTCGPIQVAGSVKSQNYYHETIYAWLEEQGGPSCVPDGKIIAEAQVNFSGGNYPAGTLTSELYRGLAQEEISSRYGSGPNLYWNTSLYISTDNGCWNAVSTWYSDATGLTSVTGPQVCF